MRLSHAPPPIRTDHSNAFANNTMRVRLPAIIDEVIALNPDYIPDIRRHLGWLRQDLETGPVANNIDPREFAASSDKLSWIAAQREQQEIIGEKPTWHNVEWFFGETLAYRCLIEAVRWHETGRDPFLPKKLEELRGDALWQLVERGLDTKKTAEVELPRTLALALWANRIDLSYAASLTRGTDISPEDLLVDDREALLAYLVETNSPSRVYGNDQPVYIVADNAGSELALDLVLADCLLRHVTSRVVICLKAHPTFVSDATPEDVWLMLSEMERRGSEIAKLALRLKHAWAGRRLRFLPHHYWNSSRFMWDLPADIHEAFKGARLVIVKGDANYRRVVGDALWPAHTPFADVVSYIDAPVLCLRTLKSDPVVGLPRAEAASRLDQIDPEWRVNGKRGVIQFKPQTSKSQ